MTPSTGHGFAPDVDRTDAGAITTCRTTRRCYDMDGSYCAEAAACEVLDKRCADLARDGCEGRCSKCAAAVNLHHEPKGE